MVNKNIIFAEERLIIHGCNAQGVMGSGVALAIRHRFPRAYREYIDTKNKYGLLLGQTIFVNCGDKWVGNCIIQQYYGRDNVQYCSYEAIENCLSSVKEFCKSTSLTSFAMPKIGCGLGGGDWNIVSLIVERVFLDSNINAVIYDNKEKIT